MKTELVRQRERIDGVYHVRLELVLGTSDTELVRSKGAPVIDVGGDFTGTPEFTLPQNDRRITESPFSISFDGNTDADAQAKALSWEAVLIERIDEALVVLRYEPDAFAHRSRSEV